MAQNMLMDDFKRTQTTLMFVDCCWTTFSKKKNISVTITNTFHSSTKSVRFIFNRFICKRETSVWFYFLKLYALGFRVRVRAVPQEWSLIVGKILGKQFLRNKPACTFDFHLQRQS